MPDQTSQKIPESIVKRIDEYDRNLDKWSYYDLLYIPRNADKTAIKKGYYKIVQLMHPDRYGLDLEEEYKKKLERIFNEINVAYNALMDDSEKARYDQALYYAEDHNQPLKVSNDVIVAKAQYTRGINAMRGNEILQAIEFFRSAADLDPDNPEYHAKLAFALAKHKNPRVRREAIDPCKKAISMQNENPNYHALMGFIFQELSDPAEAKVHYKRALSWDPQHQRARQEIQNINAQEMENKKQGSLAYKILSKLIPSKKDKKTESRSMSNRNSHPRKPPEKQR
ncbi:DnaJ domain-containing protein [bacterium]|nr:DnaJ domain-containing protein [candidate division CSSED10-310 bacterium]